MAHDVIGAAIEVHRLLGPGFLESVYEEALCIELNQRNVPYERQSKVSVEYKGSVVGEGRVDIVVGDRLIVELKSVNTISSVHRAQLLSYLKATGLTLGLLMNFNVTLLKDGVQRIVLS